MGIFFRYSVGCCIDVGFTNTTSYDQLGILHHLELDLDKGQYLALHRNRTCRHIDSHWTKFMLPIEDTNPIGHSNPFVWSTKQTLWDLSSPAIYIIVGKQTILFLFLIWPCVVWFPRCSPERIDYHQPVDPKMQGILPAPIAVDQALLTCEIPGIISTWRTQEV